MIDLIVFIICLGLSSLVSMLIVMKFDSKLDDLYQYQRKDVTDDMILSLMPDTDQVYTIEDIVGKYPHIPPKVIIAKLYQMQNKIDNFYYNGYLGVCYFRNEYNCKW